MTQVPQLPAGFDLDSPEMAELLDKMVAKGGSKDPRVVARAAELLEGVPPPETEK